MKIGEAMVTKMRVAVMMMMMMMLFVADSDDTNGVFDPCSDTKVQKLDGFTFGLAFSKKESFLFNQIQLSPCDKRLSLSNNAQLALFRPKVDEISLLTIDSKSFSQGPGVHMVAFAGQKYAARSMPVLVTDDTHTITSFTLVLEFREGTLQNLYWDNSGCDLCPRDSVCLNNQYCAVPNSKCTGTEGQTGCNLSIQLVFSGTDKNLDALNSWFEVKNLRKHSLHGLYSGIVDSVNPF